MTAAALSLSLIVILIALSQFKHDVLMMTATFVDVMIIDVKVLDARLRDRLPVYATAGAAGLDLRACVDAPGDRAVCHLVGPEAIHTLILIRGNDPAALGPWPQAWHRAGQPGD
jgi:hypothetical protein